MTVMTKSAQRVTAEDAAALVRSGDWLDYGAVLAQPDAFDTALAERVGELRNVNIRGCLSLRPRAVLEADPEREHFNFFNWHLGGYDRKLSDAGRQNYIPCNLGESPTRANASAPSTSPARASSSARPESGTARSWRTVGVSQRMACALANGSGIQSASRAEAKDSEVPGATAQR